MKIIRSFWVILVVLALVMPALAQDEEAQNEETQNEDSQSRLVLTSLLDGMQRVDTLSDTAQARLYTFYGEEGDTVTIGMTQITDALDPYLVLLGPAGQLIAIDDDGGEVGFSSLMQDVTLPVTGDYFLLASSYNYITNYTIYTEDIDIFEYTLTMDGNSFVAQALQSFTYYAGELTMGGTQRGFSTVEEPIFFYTFEGQAGDVVTLRVVDADFDTLMYLFSPTGERIAANDDFEGLNAGIGGFELPEDGVYLVFATDLGYASLPNFSEGDDIIFGGNFTIELTSGE